MVVYYYFVTVGKAPIVTLYKGVYKQKVILIIHRSNWAQKTQLQNDSRQVHRRTQALNIKRNQGETENSCGTN